MKPLLSMISAILLATLAAGAAAAPPPDAPLLPPEQKAQPDTHKQKLRDLRLREAVLRGDISEEEARRLRHLHKRHDALRLPPQRRQQASLPAQDAPPKAWHRWRKKQDTLNAPHPDDN